MNILDIEKKERNVKVIIAGSRTIKYPYYQVVKAVKESGLWKKITTVCSGTCYGIDHAGELWAEEHGRAIKRFPADWDTKGRKAGIIRNYQMATYADALIAVWDGKSRGTKNMIETAFRLDLQVYVHRVKA